MHPNKIFPVSYRDKELKKGPRLLKPKKIKILDYGVPKLTVMEFRSKLHAPQSNLTFKNVARFVQYFHA